VYSYDVVGVEIGKFTALVLPFLQLTAAVCLLARWWLRETYVISTLMFCLFTGAQALALKRGFDISCGCFGASETVHIGSQTLMVAVFGAIASLVGCLLAGVWSTACPASLSPSFREPADE
jgi:hypothetical protein